MSCLLLYLIVIGDLSFLTLGFAFSVLMYIRQQNGGVLLFRVPPGQILLLHLVCINLAQILNKILLFIWCLLLVLGTSHRRHIVDVVASEGVLAVSRAQIQRLFVNYASCHALLLYRDVDHGWSLEFHP